MRLVYSFRIDKNDKVYPSLEKMSRISKDLYNQALFEVKEHQKATGEILSYPELDKRMKAKRNREGDINYRLLPAKVAQQTLMLVSQNVRAFFAALSDYKEHPEKYQARPFFPHFLPKDGHFVLVFTNQQAKIYENSTIQLKKDLAISIPKGEFTKYKEDFIKTERKKVVPQRAMLACDALTRRLPQKRLPLFQQIRIVPKFNGDFFNVEIIYSKEEFNSDVDINRVASIDLGVNNLVTLVDSAMGEEGRIPLIINGRPLKSINQFYNKKRASIQGEARWQDGEGARKLYPLAPLPSSSINLRKITDWRNEKVDDYMHKASRFVINYCLQNRIGHIVIGKNKNWKLRVSMGKRNNQNFVSIPFARLLKQIQYKAQLVGIKVTLQEESYTSKCSALDLEEIAKHEDHAYAGKRIHRGLFLTAKSILLNADVNGALNILRKAIGDDFLKPCFEKVARLIPSSGVLWQPVKLCF